MKKKSDEGLKAAKETLRKALEAVKNGELPPAIKKLMDDKKLSKEQRNLIQKWQEQIDQERNQTNQHPSRG
ncbi:MAG: hypothetical protein KGJ06_04855 [Pseudomonadota bacterium]|nr:hypothetical protein [Pseudomonadota bacterium]